MSQPTQPQVDLERKEILESRIGLALIDIAPSQWRRVDLRASLTVETQQLQLVVVLEDGREAMASELDGDVQRRIIEAMVELRRLLYRQGAGTWFSMRLGAKPDTYSVAYDFHHEPPWQPPLEPGMYLRDLEAFPRDVMHLPDWLRGRLEEAQPGRWAGGGVTIVGRMSMEDQRDLVDEMASLLGQTLPPRYDQATFHYHAMGRHVDMRVDVLDERMNRLPWDPPARLFQMFEKLRNGMYEEGVGTWFGTRFQMHYIDSAALEFNYKEEPKWEVAPPESAYREELELFPRGPEATPYWLAQRAGLVAGPELSVAKANDATLPLPGYPNGYPTFSGRPTLADEERDGLTAYLENAPVVLTQEGGDPDLFDRTGATRIPREYRTDGSWVWSASVAYYLRAHNVAPERGLVEHIRAQDFQVPDVDQGTRDAAVAAIRGGTA